MRFPDDDGLPLWLFILVILISTTSIGLFLFVVWRKCSKRSSGLRVLPSDIFEPTERKRMVRRGQIVPFSSSNSLTGPRFSVGASHQQSRRSSQRWPEVPYSDGIRENVPKLGNHGFLANAPSLKDHSPSVLKRPGPGLLQRRGTADLGVPVDFPADEENLRASYPAEPVDLMRKVDDDHVKSKWLNVEPLLLNSPTRLSLITPLALPRTRRNPHISVVGLKTLSQLAAMPPPPAHPHRLSRCREEISSTCTTKQTDGRKLESRFSPSYNGYSQSRGYRCSTATSTSVLRAWSEAYQDWLVHPEYPSSSSSTKADIPGSSHIDGLVRVPNPSLKSEDELGRDVSLPSQTPISFNGSVSPVSHALSSETTSIRSERDGRGQHSGRNTQIKRSEISWLVDD